MISLDPFKTDRNKPLGSSRQNLLKNDVLQSNEFDSLAATDLSAFQNTINNFNIEDNNHNNKNNLNQNSSKRIYNTFSGHYIRAKLTSYACLLHRSCVWMFLLSSGLLFVGLVVINFSISSASSSSKNSSEQKTELTKSITKTPCDPNPCPINIQIYEKSFPRSVCVDLTDFPESKIKLGKNHICQNKPVNCQKYTNDYFCGHVKGSVCYPTPGGYFTCLCRDPSKQIRRNVTESSLYSCVPKK